MAGHARGTMLFFRAKLSLSLSAAQVAHTPTLSISRKIKIMTHGVTIRTTGGYIDRFKVSLVLLLFLTSIKHARVLRARDEDHASLLPRRIPKGGTAH
jgi:hypothetical protein